MPPIKHLNGDIRLNYNKPKLLYDYQQLSQLLMYHTISDFDIIPDREVCDLLTGCFNALLTGCILGIFPFIEGIGKSYLTLYQNLPHLLPKIFTYLVDPAPEPVSLVLCNISKVSYKIHLIKQKEMNLLSVNAPEIEDIQVAARRLLADFTINHTLLPNRII